MIKMWLINKFRTHSIFRWVGALIFTLFFSFLSLPRQVIAADWAQTEETFKYVPGQIEYFNRSSCAKKSLEPTSSVFLIVDNVNIAKSVYRLAKMKKLDTVSATNLGIEKFRYSLANLIRIISAKLLNKTLPLIKDERILKNCEAGDCLELDRLLENNWRASGASPDFKKHSQCKIVKKFSTLHSNLKVSKPDRVLLEEMAKEIQSGSEYASFCEDFSDMSQPEVALYQFDLKTPANFNEFGFEFWSSFKIYLSWAFRNAPEMIPLAEPFDYLFKSVNLEETLLFFSNGCRSIKSPTCAEKDISLDNLRFLTETTGKLDWSEMDSVRHVPASSPLEQFSEPLSLMEDDLLNLGDQQNADEWTKNFRDNFIRSRGYNKIKLSKAINNLSLITQNASGQLVTERVAKDVSTLSQDDKQSLYYLCTEYSIAGDKDLSFIRRDLWKLKDLKIFDEVMKEMSNSNMEMFWNHFSELSENINKLCHGLKQKEIWDENFELKKNGFSPWYQELVYEKKFNFSEEMSIKSPKNEKPFLSIRGGSVLCENGIHCARVVLDSMMSLSAISHNFSSLIPGTREILSNNMANPYASRMSCGAYDPWAKRNQVVYDAIHDLVQTAAFGFIPTPVYVAANLDPKTVVSFDTLVKDGKVYFDPNFNKKRLKMSLIADLGPFIGIPCAVSISGSKVNPYQYYMFNGISVSSCKETGNNSTVVSSGNDQETSKTYRQVCAACAINLQTITASVSSINPFFRAGFFLIKGVVRLVSNLKNPHDLARDWSITPNQVSLSYRYNGEISKSCAKKLLKGKSCLDEACAGPVLDSLTRDYEMSPTYSDFSCLRKRAYLEVKECKDPIYVKFDKEGSTLDTNCQLKKRSL